MFLAILVEKGFTLFLIKADSLADLSRPGNIHGCFFHTVCILTSGAACLSLLNHCKYQRTSDVELTLIGAKEDTVRLLDGADTDRSGFEVAGEKIVRAFGVLCKKAHVRS